MPLENSENSENNKNNDFLKNIKNVSTIYLNDSNDRNIFVHNMIPKKLAQEVFSFIEGTEHKSALTLDIYLNIKKK